MNLIDEQPIFIPPYFPKIRPSGGHGFPPLCQRALVNGMLWKMSFRRTRQDKLSRNGSYQVSYQYHHAWERFGLLGKILDVLVNDILKRGKMSFD